MKRPWMPLYVADFIADTTQLTATETGIYIRLILHCWQHGSIPTDDKKLSLIAHCDSRLWRQYRETVLKFFDVVDASTMHHRRVTKELLRSDEISSKRKAAAMQKHSKSSALAPANSTAIVYTLHTSQLQEEERKKDGAKAPPDLFPSEQPTEEKLYFDLVTKTLGAKGRGLGAKLRNEFRKQGKSLHEAHAVVAQARTKSNPAEYIGAVIRGTHQADEMPALKAGYGDSWW